MLAVRDVCMSLGWLVQTRGMCVHVLHTAKYCTTLESC